MTSAAARSSGSHSGDLLRGLIPAPTGGSVLGGLQPGVRRVEVVMPQGDREVAHVERDTPMPAGPPRSYGPGRGVEGVLAWMDWKEVGRVEEGIKMGGRSAPPHILVPWKTL